jgi:DNA-binding NarL/FixJ family response regulator
MGSQLPTPRIVVLKGHKLYGDMICRQIKDYWRGAVIEHYQKGFDALDSIQAAEPDLFVTGVKIEDMDGLEHLEPFIDKDLPILVITSKKDDRTFSLLREVRFTGLFDVCGESLSNLPTALQSVIERKSYISEAFHSLIKRPKYITLDNLTQTEEMVLAVIGDGCDDDEAGERMGLSPGTIMAHRRAIMQKLKIHHKGQLMCYALKKGYVSITPERVDFPGFKRRILRRQREKQGEKKSA